MIRRIWNSLARKRENLRRVIGSFNRKMDVDPPANEIPKSSTNGTNSDTEYAIVNEGKASVLFPENVFYNPVQEFNRDLTIAVISTFTRLIAKEEANEVDVESLGRTRKRKIRILSRRKEQDGGGKKQQPTSVTILEGLAATGLRSVRFAREIPAWLPASPPTRLRIIANDLDPGAAQVARENVVRNGVGDVMSVECDDVVMLMLKRLKEARCAEEKRAERERENSSRGGGGEGNKSDSEEEANCGMNEGEPFVDYNDRLFQVIDLDPYGTAAPFLDSAVQALADGGLLCVTCTDSAVLCGQTPETCFTKYGSVSLRSKFCHEQAIRIVLHCISSHASRHSKFIEPLISLSIDFYIRVFVRVHVGQAQAKLAYTKTALLFNCSGCGAHSLQPMGNIERIGNSVKYLSSPVISGVGEKCIHCQHRVHVGGPLWAEKIHNTDFVRAVKDLAQSPDTPDLNTKDRIVGMLTVVDEELPDVPLYFVMDEGICGALRCFTPPAVKYRSAILNAGYRVSLSHAAESSVKTDAPTDFLWDLMRAWVKEIPVDSKRMVEGSVSFNILSAELKREIDFTPHPDATSPSQIQGLKRFPPNPESHWGPKPRAKRRDIESPNSEESKSKKPKRKNAEKVKPDLKQFVCKKFLVGNCERDESECVYSHDDDKVKQARSKEEKVAETKSDVLKSAAQT